MIFLQDPDDLKEVTTIMERLLRRSLSTILKRLFEIRKESQYLWIYYKYSLQDHIQWSPYYKVPAIFKEVTTIMERLLRTSFTTILKRIFEIRKESRTLNIFSPFFDTGTWLKSIFPHWKLIKVTISTLEIGSNFYAHFCDFLEIGWKIFFR